jgi:hypothetical protein
MGSGGLSSFLVGLSSFLGGFSSFGVDTPGAEKDGNAGKEGMEKVGKEGSPCAKFSKVSVLVYLICKSYTEYF